MAKKGGGGGGEAPHSPSPKSDSEYLIGKKAPVFKKVAKILVGKKNSH